jgi:DNA ligase-1
VKAFVALYDELDATTSTNAKVAAVARYFRETPAADAAWGLFFLSGRRFKRLLPYRLLVEWTEREVGLPEWIFGECYGVVGDLGEVCALLLDARAAEEREELPLHEWVARIAALPGLEPEEQRAAVVGWWRRLAPRERYVLNKLLTGELRVGVSATLVVRAVAAAAAIPAELAAQRLMGEWEPSAALFAALVAPEGEEVATPGAASRPYPFYLASPLEGPAAALGDRVEWLAEWKWDGIRCQLLRRGDATHLWSRGEELVTERFPEVVQAAEALPAGLVLDGEIMAWRDGPLPFAVLQRRIGRKALGPKILAEAPVGFVAYDLLEQDGRDARALPLDERRARLAKAIERARDPRLVLSPAVDAPDWDALASLREEARHRRVEGLMLKRRSSPYRQGRRRGDWWKWKIDPFTIDAVLIYAQTGSGRRASLFTDYTFAVWRDGELVPVAKAYSGLTQAEIDELDRWIRRNTRERHGPVRVVEPVHVFELAFEGIAESPRHRSGIALRFPRMARWRKDKPASEADTLATLRRLL